MSWRWEFSNKAADEFDGLDNNIRKRIVQKLNFWIDSDKPIRFAEILVNFDLGAYRFRVGDYRIVFDVEGETIVILTVGHRREIYK